MAVEPLTYTVSDAAGGGSTNEGGISGEQAGVRDGTLPESGGAPTGLLFVAGVALLLTSAAGLSLALRRGGNEG